MRIKKSKLKQIIREELNEAGFESFIMMEYGKGTCWLGVDDKDRKELMGISQYTLDPKGNFRDNTKFFMVGEEKRANPTYGKMFRIRTADEIEKELKKMQTYFKDNGIDA